MHYASRYGTSFIGRPFGEGFDRGTQNLLVGEHRGRSVRVLEYFYKPRVGKKNQEPQVYTGRRGRHPWRVPDARHQPGPSPSASTAAT